MELKFDMMEYLIKTYTLLIAPLMELKSWSNTSQRWYNTTFNRTAYGIEIGLTRFLRVIVLSFNRTAYGIEICYVDGGAAKGNRTFNRTAYGIEMI